MSAALKPAGAFPAKLRTGFAFRLATLTATIFVASSVMAQDAAPQTAPQVTAPQAAPAPAVTPPPAVQVTQPVQQPTPALAEPTQPQAPAATPTDTPAVSQTPAQQPSAGEPADGLPATAGQPDFTQPLPEQPVIEPQEAEAPASDQPLDVLTQFFDPEYRSDLPHDLSPWGMFMAADWVVKAVMIGLAFASLVTWTVWLAKSLELAGARARAIRALKIIRSARSLSEAVNAAEGRGGPAARMLRAADEEMQLSEAVIDHAEGDGVKERVTSVLSRIEAYAGRRMSHGTGVLATIGSTAPFVGLFGTVWGIMNSFIGISETQTTNLAVVAPGIAEALLATAIGLVAAIPAVVIYNVFARSVTGYRQLLADAAAGVERLVSRDLDFRKVPPGARAAPMSLVSGG